MFIVENNTKIVNDELRYYSRSETSTYEITNSQDLLIKNGNKERNWKDSQRLEVLQRS